MPLPAMPMKCAFEKFIDPPRAATSLTVCRRFPNPSCARIVVRHFDHCKVLRSSVNMAPPTPGAGHEATGILEPFGRCRGMAAGGAGTAGLAEPADPLHRAARGRRRARLR